MAVIEPSETSMTGSCVRLVPSQSQAAVMTVRMAESSQPGRIVVQTGPVRLGYMPSTTTHTGIRRIGIHLGTGGGASTAVERAREIGANTFQIFSSSPRMWKAPRVDPEQG